VRHAVYLPPHGVFADPRRVVEVAVAAEVAGWDGVFLWDHLLRPKGKPPEVADAYMCLAAIAMATSSIRLGPMVTPLARRRPQRVARETVTLDHLSGGRLTLGIGLGVNTGGELERFDEEVDDRSRGDLLDEALELLVELWSGELVDFRGDRFVARDVRFLPRPAQRPRIPIWAAARGGAPARTLLRAARCDGLFPVQTSLEQLVRMLATIAAARGGLAGFDVALSAEEDVSNDELDRAGVTWRIRAIPEGAEPSSVRSEVAAGPPS
jgi:alkanesulfonate monooxygenase SsuD/methylene tetrahydromethanopterin reductase-like flavin-dependent oxidoreductase (luciferase family)